jgi:Nucleosome assembly protein (NAP)
VSGFFVCLSVYPRYRRSSDPSADTNRTRLIRKVRPTESFFNFFTPPVPPPDEDVDNGEIDVEELEEIEEKLEMDYQIGEDLKEKVRATTTTLSLLLTHLSSFPLPRSSLAQ